MKKSALSISHLGLVYEASLIRSSQVRTLLPFFPHLLLLLRWDPSEVGKTGVGWGGWRHKRGSGGSGILARNNIENFDHHQMDLDTYISQLSLFAV